MIKKCINEDARKLLDYLYLDKVMNLFAIGDILNFGVDSETMDVWVDENDKGIKTIYLKYLSNMVISSNSDEVDNDFVAKLIEEYGHMNFNGKTSVLSKVNFPDTYVRKPCYFASIENVNEQFLNNNEDIRRIGLDEAKAYHLVQTSIFGDHLKFEDIKNNLEHPKSARYYALYKDGNIVSIGASTAECEGLAMIVSVGTIENERKKGYASKLVAKLSDDLLKENKISCLFYNNPDAASVYMKIGYKKVGEFTICG